MHSSRPSKKQFQLTVQSLEDRTVPAVFGNPWADARHLTISFVPDGTAVNGAASNLFQTMQGQSATWQREILRALQTWVAAANIDVDLVPDSGAFDWNAEGRLKAIRDSATFVWPHGRCRTMSWRSLRRRAISAAPAPATS